MVLLSLITCPTVTPTAYDAKISSISNYTVASTSTDALTAFIATFHFLTSNCLQPQLTNVFFLLNKQFSYFICHFNWCYCLHTVPPNTSTTSTKIFSWHFNCFQWLHVNFNFKCHCFSLFNWHSKCHWVSEWWSHAIARPSVGVSSLAVALSKWIGRNVSYVAT